MENNHKKNRSSAIVIRWFARVIGTIISFFWFASLVLSFIAEFGEPVHIEGIILFILIVANTAGVITAWIKEKAGGIITITAAISLCIFSYISAGHHKIFAMSISGFPFLISGILFIISWWMIKKVPSHK